jgi:hypothetical protein
VRWLWRCVAKAKINNRVIGSCSKNVEDERSISSGLGKIIQIVEIIPNGDGSPTMKPVFSMEGATAVSPNSALASLREAVKQVERDDYLDGQAAISAAISELVEEHGIVTFDQETADQANSPTTSGAAATTDSPSTTKLSKPNRRASVNEDAKMLMQQMGIELKPKPSDSIAIEKDIENLIQNMDSQAAATGTAVSSSATMGANNKTKPANARYLRALEAKKRQQQQSQTQSSSQHHLRTSTELSDLSKKLIESENSRWCQNFSQTAFKSHNEEMLFRNMQKMVPMKGSKGSSSSSSLAARAVSSHEINRQTIKQKQKEFHDSWSQLGRRGGRGREGERMYMRDDDNENCLFQPTTNETKKKTQAGGSSPDDEDNEKSQGSTFESFIARQEANERARRQDNEASKGKEDYEKYSLNKKYCPVCHGKQSYDEVKEKRKNCPNCHVAYRPKTCWGDIEERFYNRQNKYYMKYQQNEEKREKERGDEIGYIEVKKMNQKTGEIRQIKQKGVVRRDENGEIIKWTKDLEKEFFHRHEEYEEKIQRKLLQVEREMYGKEMRRDEEEEKEREEREETSSGRRYYHRPQREHIGSTWSSGSDKRNDARSFSAGRLGLRREYAERGSGSSPSHSSTQRTARDENEYLFRYRRK